MDASRPWLERLPVELLHEISTYLEGPDLIALRQTSSQVSAGASMPFGDHFFGTITTDLYWDSLPRLLAATRFEGPRHRVRVLHITTWHDYVPYRSRHLHITTWHDGVPYRSRRHNQLQYWRRNGDGAIIFESPMAQAVLAGIRDGFPGCRSLVVDDANGAGPDRPILARRRMSGTDCLALAVALAGTLPVTSLTVTLASYGLEEYRINPSVLGRADWNALETLRFEVRRIISTAGPQAGEKEVTSSSRPAWVVDHRGIGAIQTFIHSLLSSAPNLQTVQIGGDRSMDYCIPLLSEQGRTIRHLTLGGYTFHSSYVPMRVLNDWMASYSGGDKLESLEFVNINATRVGDFRPWKPFLSRIHATFPNLQRFKLMNCRVHPLRHGRMFLCALLPSLTARLGPGLDSPYSHEYSDARWVTISDEHGGTFRILSEPRRAYDRNGERKGPRLHDLGVEYKLGPSGTAEGMKCALSDIAESIGNRDDLFHDDECTGRPVPGADQEA
ncbi:hypothetical protein GGTG_12572 [Gaeumannomyces tritici R3-111a-1]|uniref:F-box domain-containing protein n=1 Tax=Gaeumannomyces tritici (strain R3-111a-1) TaxID=644352 RepID=J3PGE7_GAET3|nr:hypothetical protein GGTG_12572 [Gaeumannomyces tritici R3-111a-1]EJT69689.1 hypothetical protein GGTG_12572 [Gaeumannomyces tritici R3-111a-1]